MLQVILQSPEGPAPVAHAVLLLRAGTSEGLLQVVAVEQWIVAKPLCAVPSIQNPAAAGPLERPSQCVRPWEVHQDAPVARPTSLGRRAGQAAQEFVVVGFVDHIGSAVESTESFGADTRRAGFERGGALGVDGLTDAFVATYEDGTQALVATLATAEAAATVVASARETFEFLGSPAVLEAVGARVLGSRSKVSRRALP